MTSTIKRLVLLTLVLILTVLSYYPGLKGGFLFDDYINLNKLKIIGDDVTKESVKEYLLAHNAGPTKRPISTLSFLLNDQNWPSNQQKSFKVTNLFIHLINGILLYFLLFNVFNLFPNYRGNAHWMAIVATAVWLIHPYFVSTTMYIVQRMAMLPATFSLIGLLLYLKGRQLYGHQNNKSVLLLLTSVVLCTLLAIFSKENGVLLLAFIALFEFIILRRISQIKPLDKFMLWLLIIVPNLLLLAVLVYKFPQQTADYDLRSFTMYERILTEFRILSKYLYYLILPNYFTEGVFSDGIQISKGLINPISTIFSVIFIIGLNLSAILIRKKHPLIAFSILFFFIGHILESSYIPLELYFEHRNYLPGIFLFVPVAVICHSLFGEKIKLWVIPAILIGFLCFLTFLRSSIWGNSLLLHHESMQKFPESVRAANTTAAIYSNHGNLEMALAILAQTIQRHDDLQLRFNQTALKCVMGTVTEADVASLNQNLRSTPFRKTDFESFRNLIHSLGTKECFAPYGKLAVNDLLNSFKTNEFFNVGLAQKFFYFSYGINSIHIGAYDQALNSFKDLTIHVEEIEQDPIFESSMLQAIDVFTGFKQDKMANELTDFLIGQCELATTDCKEEFINQLREKKL